MAHKVWGGRYLTEKETDTFLRESKTARICTLNDDGTIHAAPVWYEYEKGEIIIITPNHSRKARNVKRNRSVSILIDIEKPPKGVLLYGTAELESNFDLESIAIAIGKRYMSEEEAKANWQTMVPPTTKWLKINVKPDSITSFSYYD
jgi:PPOX class probable F420-dependent enzyme